MSHAPYVGFVPWREPVKSSATIISSKRALRWFLWERFRYNPSLASENNDLELKRPREGPLRRRTPMIAKPNKDNRRGVTREEFTTSRPRTDPHGHPGRPHRGRAHRRNRPAPQKGPAPLPGPEAAAPHVIPLQPESSRSPVIRVLATISSFVRIIANIAHELGGQ